MQPLLTSSLERAMLARWRRKGADRQKAEIGKPKVHAHVVLGRPDGTTCGRHILEAHVWPTPEAMVAASPPHLRRTTDKQTGLALLDIGRERVQRREDEYG